MSITIKQTLNHSTSFFDHHLPMGAVYAILPADTHHGKARPKTYVWVEDLQAAKMRQHFTVMLMTRDDTRPRKVYVDGSQGYARRLKEYIQTLSGDKMVVIPTITRRQIGTIAPKERKIGAYIKRAVPSAGDDPRTITNTSVTAGAHVGKVYLTEEGYAHNRMGVKTPDMGDNGYLKTATVPNYMEQVKRMEEHATAHKAGK